MKQLLVIIALLITTLVNAQIGVTPDRSAEYCPNDEYSFTVTSLPGKYKSIDASGGAIGTEVATKTNEVEPNLSSADSPFFSKPFQFPPDPHSLFSIKSANDTADRRLRF